MSATNGRDYIFQAAVLKGAIEHGDGTAYFGSLLAYAEHKAGAIKLGWVETVEEPERAQRLVPTPKGQQVYTEVGLAKFTKVKFSRAYGWDWSKIIFKPEHL